ncbi:hypothetical protein VTO42DRAFT_4972 [Malbranchea cinnamomea]
MTEKAPADRKPAAGVMRAAANQEQSSLASLVVGRGRMKPCLQKPRRCRALKQLPPPHPRCRDEQRRGWRKHESPARATAGRLVHGETGRPGVGERTPTFSESTTSQHPPDGASRVHLLDEEAIHHLPLAPSSDNHPNKPSHQLPASPWATHLQPIVGSSRRRVVVADEVAVGLQGGKEIIIPRGEPRKPVRPCTGVVVVFPESLGLQSMEASCAVVRAWPLQ